MFDRVTQRRIQIGTVFKDPNITGCLEHRFESDRKDDEFEDSDSLQQRASLKHCCRKFAG
ncbi:MAG: hypothetical protein JWM11_1415 [Planctomycetaceae bacterium]|nr:hypothetical protein [Planctomycetaceae bacterium]